MAKVDKEKQPLVSVIIPTYNSEKNLKNLLESFTISSYSNFEIIINDDLRTNDRTRKLVNYYKKNISLTYIQKNKSMAQGRKEGFKHSKGSIILHMDSDMKITKNLLKEITDKIKYFDALVIPENSYGTTFWAKCKWLEKKCYEGNNHIESLRVMKREVYEKVNGHNENMVFSEDKDLDIRVRKENYKIGRTKNFLWHNEGNLKLINTMRKKQGYSKTAHLFAKSHPIQYKWQKNPLNRYYIFLKNIKYLFIHPILYFGMIFMKTSEYLSAGWYILLLKIKSKKIYKIILVFYTFKNWHMFILDYLGIIGNKNIKYICRNKAEMYSRSNSTDKLELVVIFSGYEYPLNNIDLINVNTVIDIGGHIGSFSVYLGTKIKNNNLKYYIFEPCNDNFKLLSQNIKHNKLSNVLLFNKAVGLSNSVGYMNMSKSFDALTVESERINDSYEKIDVVNILDVVRDNNIDLIDILKIDCEGFEHVLFNNLKFQQMIIDKVRYLFIEIHNYNNSTVSDLLKKIVKLGLTIERLNNSNTFLIENKNFKRRT